MKLPFRRNKTSNDQLPAEIQNYYQSEQRERMGVAWLLAAGVFLLTLLIASGIFFGGKWVYRKLAHKDGKPTTAQVQQQSNDGTAGNSDGGQTTTPDTTTPTTPSTPTPAPSTTPSTPAPASTPANLPNTNGDE